MGLFMIGHILDTLFIINSWLYELAVSIILSATNKQDTFTIVRLLLIHSYSFTYIPI